MSSGNTISSAPFFPASRISSTIFSVPAFLSNITGAHCTTATRQVSFRSFIVIPPDWTGASAPRYSFMIANPFANDNTERALTPSR